mmetsp:Transcript_66940/g.134932  ORF Transcript_66940/g.134932 Transcript_66940/m.134932 type:complete len:558 (+) Transcript_66940:112-1785(+)
MPSTSSASLVPDFASARIVEAALESGFCDYGILQRGFSFQRTIPLTLKGVRADPTRFRCTVLPHKKGALRQDHFEVRFRSGAVGRALAGVPQPLQLEVDAWAPGKFEARVLIASEGGECQFVVRGHILDGPTFRSFAKTKVQSNAKLLAAGVNKGAALTDKRPVALLATAVPGPESSVDLGSLLSKLPSRVGVGDPKVGKGRGVGFAEDEWGLPLCREADAVETLLTEEQLEEYESMPAVPGTYVDRKTGKLKLAPQAQRAWRVDPQQSLQAVVGDCERARDESLAKMERKGVVTTRVVSRLQHKVRADPVKHAAQHAEAAAAAAEASALRVSELRAARNAPRLHHRRPCRPGGEKEEKEEEAGGARGERSSAAPKRWRHHELDALWQRYDANGNGVLTLNEVDDLVAEVYPEFRKTERLSPFLTLAYKLADSDRSGLLTRAGGEFGSLMKCLGHFEHLWRQWRSMDDNKDHLLSLSEFLAKRALLNLGHLEEHQAASLFQRIDVNGDGSLSFFEAASYLARHLDEDSDDDDGDSGVEQETGGVKAPFKAYMGNIGT